jgi:hypothetical protein
MYIIGLLFGRLGRDVPAHGLGLIPGDRIFIALKSA